MSPANAGWIPGATGFLPETDPLRVLPDPFAAWEEASRILPKILVSGNTRRILAALPVVESDGLGGSRQLERAMLLLSFLSHGFVWAESEPASVLPECLARPWYAVATALGRKPVLSYASYALNNWFRVDPSAPVELGNVALLQNFLGGADEEWFVGIHIAIEAEAARALMSFDAAQSAVASGEGSVLEPCLSTIATSLESMVSILARTPEWCDPYIYYRRVRPFIHGWKGHPRLKGGLIYAGVSAYSEAPQRFRGETGAQSSIVPALDALLGIQHSMDPLREYLDEMREYMPPEHRAFIDKTERRGAVREFVLVSGMPSLEAAYDECVDQLARFRSQHLEFAASYIHSQASFGHANPTDVGTGGTPFMAYLKKHHTETGAHKT